MSQENVEPGRRAYEAFNRGDSEGIVADIAPEFEYVATGAIPGVGGAYGGAEGLRQFLESFWGEFDEPRVEVRELIEAGDQVVAALTFRLGASRAAQRPTGTSGMCGRCGTARSFVGRRSRAGTTPSKRRAFGVGGVPEERRDRASDCRAGKRRADWDGANPRTSCLSRPAPFADGGPIADRRCSGKTMPTSTEPTCPPLMRKGG